MKGRGAFTEDEEKEFQKRRIEESKKYIKVLGYNSVKEHENVLKQSRKEAEQEAAEDVLSDEQFIVFVDDLCKQFAEDASRKAFVKAAKRTLDSWQVGSTISVREEILLTFQAMKRAEDYYKNH